MLCSRTASLRATATRARFLPRLPPLAASFSPHRRSAESGPTAKDVLRRLHQQTTQVDVAGPGNAHLRIAVSRLALSGAQPQECARRAVGSAIGAAQREHIGRGHHWPHARHRAQNTDFRILLPQLVDLPVQRGIWRLS